MIYFREETEMDDFLRESSENAELSKNIIEKIAAGRFFMAHELAIANSCGV